MSLTIEQIADLIDQLESETKALRSEILEMCWHMRGSLSFDEGMQLSYSDREAIAKIIKSHMETTQKSGLPYF